MSHTQFPDASTVEPTTDSEPGGTHDMDEAAQPIVAKTAGDLPTRERAASATKRSEWITYGVTLVAIVFAIQGMVSFGMDVLMFPLWFAVVVSGFLELAMAAFASWDQTDALKGRRPKAVETWIAAVASGVLSSLHMFAHRTDAGVVWAFGPFEILGGLIRLLPPLVAALLLHKIVRSDLLESEGRTDREVKIAKRMHAVARASVKVQRLRDTYESPNFFERWLIQRAEASHDRVFDKAVKVLPATDPRFNVEMQTWARGLAVADILPGLTKAQLDDDAMHVNQVIKAAQPSRRPTRRPAPAARATQPVATPPNPARSTTDTPGTAVQPSVAVPAAPEVSQDVQEAPVRPRTGSTPRVDTEKAAMQAKMRDLFDQAVADSPGVKPDASKLHDAAGVGEVASKATTRRWVQGWWNDVVVRESTAGIDDASSERDAAQLGQEAARPDLTAVRAAG